MVELNDLLQRRKLNQLSAETGRDLHNLGVGVKVASSKIRRRRAQAPQLRVVNPQSHAELGDRCARYADLVLLAPDRTPAPRSWSRPAIVGISDRTALCSPDDAVRPRQFEQYSNLKKLKHTLNVLDRFLASPSQYAPLMRKSPCKQSYGRKVVERIRVVPVNRMLTIETRQFEDVLRWIAPMRNIVLFLAILLALGSP